MISYYKLKMTTIGLRYILITLYVYIRYSYACFGLSLVWEGQNFTSPQITIPGLNYGVVRTDHIERRDILFDKSINGNILRVSYGYNKTNDKGYGTQFWSRIINDTEAMLSYDMFLNYNFIPALGGKLPGLYGINEKSENFDGGGCTGGFLSNGKNCWSARLMWREMLLGEVYAYIPPTENTHLCKNIDENKYIECNAEFGMSIGRNFTFVRERWINVKQYIKLNTIGYKNGLLRLYIDDELVVYASNLVFRITNDLTISGMLFSTFYGGKCDIDSNWCPPNPTYAYFKNFKIYGTKKNILPSNNPNICINKKNKQCDGQTWQGPRCCSSNLKCIYKSPYYSYCG